MKRIISFVLCLSMLVSMLPVSAFAADVEESTPATEIVEEVTEAVMTEAAVEETTEAEEPEEESEPTEAPEEEPAETTAAAEETEAVIEEVTEPAAAAEESEEVLLEIAPVTLADLPDEDELFAGYVDKVFYGGTEFFGTAAGETLTGDVKVLYDGLRPQIEAIAAGELDNAELTVSGGFTGNTITQPMLQQLVRALLADIPYELYWYDKTVGCGGGYATDETDVVEYVTLRFAVSPHYNDANGTWYSNPETGAKWTYDLDTAKTGAASAAAENAAAIVEQNAALGDYEKLVAYKQKICALTAYNDAAAKPTYSGGYGDPWQLIWVFDNDTATKVVCEGYAKAFQYLCDLSDFKADIVCYNVQGYMYDSKGNGGGHMWNIVDINGSRYLVDVTNSDAGSVGASGGLFLVGGSGSAASGYTFLGETFTYDDAAITMWGTGTDSVLTLATANFDPESLVEQPMTGEELVAAMEAAQGQYVPERPIVIDSDITLPSNVMLNMYTAVSLTVTGTGSLTVTGGLGVVAGASVIVEEGGSLIIDGSLSMGAGGMVAVAGELVNNNRISVSYGSLTLAETGTYTRGVNSWDMPAILSVDIAGSVTGIDKSLVDLEIDVYDQTSLVNAMVPQEGYGSQTVYLMCEDLDWNGVADAPVELSGTVTIPEGIKVQIGKRNSQKDIVILTEGSELIVNGELYLILAQNDVIIEEGAALIINGYMANFSNLIVEGTLENNATIQQSSTLTVEQSGAFLNDGEIYNEGAIINNGTFVQSGTLDYWEGGTFEGNDPIEGIAGTVTWDTDNHVGDKVFIPEGAELIIPEGVTICIYRDMDVRGKLTVNGTLKVYHPGSLSINGGTVEITEGAMLENGGNTFVNAGELIIDGDMCGYNPVVVDGTVSGSALGRYQDAMEEMLAGAAAGGYPAYLMGGQIYVLERDLTVDCELYLFGNLVVPEGVTLTNNGSIICEFGRLDVHGDYVAGENGKLYSMYWGAEWDDMDYSIPGVPNDQVVLLYKSSFASENQGIDLISFWTRTGWAGYEAYVDDSMTLTHHLTIPAGKTLEITDTLTVSSGCTLTVSGELIIAEGGKLIVEEGATLANYGSVVNNGAFFLQGQSTGSGAFEGNEPTTADIMTQEDFLAALEAAEGSYELTQAVVITEDLQIPADLFVYYYGPGSITVTNGAELFVPGSSTLGLSMGGKLTVEEGSSLCVEGRLSVGQGGNVTVNGGLYNYGYLEIAGTLWVNGYYSDNGGVVDIVGPGVAVLDAQDRFMAALNNGGEVHLDEEVTIEEDLTIDQGEEIHVILHENASLIVADGVTLTVDSPMVLLGGRIVLEGSSTLVLNDRVVLETDASELWADSYATVTVNDTGSLIVNNGTSEINGELYVLDDVATAETFGSVHVGMLGTGELNITNAPMYVNGYVCVHSGGTMNADAELYIYNNENGCGYLDVYGAAYLNNNVFLDGLMSVGSDAAADGYAEDAARIEVNSVLTASETSGVYVNHGGSFCVNDTIEASGELTVEDGGVLWVDGTVEAHSAVTNDGHIRVGYFEAGELYIHNALTNNGFVDSGTDSSVYLWNEMTNNGQLQVNAGGTIYADYTVDNYGVISVAENAFLNQSEGTLRILTSEDRKGELNISGYANLEGEVILNGFINVGNENAQDGYADNHAELYKPYGSLTVAEDGVFFVHKGGRFYSGITLNVSGQLQVNAGGVLELNGDATFGANSYVRCFGDMYTNGTVTVGSNLDIVGGYAELNGNTYLGNGGSIWVVEGGYAKSEGTLRVLKDAAVHVVDGKLEQNGEMFVSGYLAVRENGEFVSNSALNILNDSNGCGYLDNAGRTVINSDLYLDGLFTTGAAKEDGVVVGKPASADVPGYIYGGDISSLGVLTGGDVNVSGNMETTGEVRTETGGTLWVEGDVYLNGQTTMDPDSSIHVNFFGSSTDPEIPEEMKGDGLAYLYVGGRLTNYGYLAVNPNGTMFVKNGGTVTIQKNEDGAGYLNIFGSFNIEDGGSVYNYALMDVAGNQEYWGNLNINEGGSLYVSDNIVMAVRGYSNVYLDGQLIMMTGSYMEIQGSVNGYNENASWINNGTIRVGVDRERDDYTGNVSFFGTYRHGEDARLEVELYDSGYYSYPLYFYAEDADGYEMQIPQHLYAVNPSDIVDALSWADEYETMTIDITESGYVLYTGDERNIELVIPENVTVNVLADVTMPYGYEVDNLGEIFVGAEAQDEEEIPTGTLNIEGGLSLDHPGALTVYNGSVVNVSGTVHNGTAITVDGLLNIPGKLIGYFPVVLENGQVTGSGLPSNQDVFESMIRSAAAVGYPAHLTSDLELIRDVNIGCNLVIDEDVTLTIPEGVRVNAYGPLHVKGDLVVAGTLKLYHTDGTLSVFEGGTVTVAAGGLYDNNTATTVHGSLVINGTWEGYPPVSAGSGTITGTNVPVQEFFEATLKAAEAGGYPAHLTSDLKLTSDIEINCRLIIDKGVTLTVPKNVTVTVGQQGMLEASGTLTVSSGGKLVNNGNLFANAGGKISCASSTYSGEGFVNVMYENGSVGTVSGVAKTAQYLQAVNVADETALHTALNYIKTNKYMGGLVTTGEEIELTKDLTIESNVTVITQEGLFLIPENVTLVNNGLIRLGDASIMADEYGAVMPVGGNLENYGQIVVHGDSQLILNTDVHNFGALTVEGMLIQNNSRLYNHAGTVQILEDAVLELDDESDAFNSLFNGSFGTFENYPAESVYLHAMVSSVAEIDAMVEEYDPEKYYGATSQVNKSFTLDKDVELVSGHALMVANSVTLTIAENASVTIRENSSIWVTASGHLINNGTVYNGSGFYIQPGCSLTNNGVIESNVSYYTQLHIRGTYENNGQIIVTYIPASDEITNYNGITAEDLVMKTVIADEYDLQAALNRAEEENFGTAFIHIVGSDMVLYEDLIIPENTTLRTILAEDQSASLYIPDGVTVTNNGSVEITAGTTLTVDGTWLGNNPWGDGVITGENAPMSQEDFQALLAKAAEEGKPADLYAHVKLTESMATNDVFLNVYGSITVPSGVTLTLNGHTDIYGDLVVEEGGKVVVGYRMCAMPGSNVIVNGTYENAIADSHINTLFVVYEDGECGSVVGVPEELLLLNFTTCDGEDQLREYIDLVTSGDYWYGMIFLREDLPLNEDLVIPENIQIVMLTDENTMDGTATFEVDEDITVTNRGVFLLNENTELVIDGHWLGNLPENNGTVTGTNVPVSQEQLLEMMANAENGILGLENDVTLTEDLTVDLNMLQIAEGTVLYVPAGVTLTLTGDAVIMGKLLVEEGAAFINNSWMGVELTGVVDIAEGCYSGEGDVVVVYINDDEQPAVNGIDTKQQTLLCIACEYEDDIRYVYEKSADYKWITVSLYMDMELVDDLEIPENASLQIYCDPYAEEGITFTLPDGVTLTNNGIVKVFNKCVLVIDGDWLGNLPVAEAEEGEYGTITGSNVPMSMEDFLLLLQEEAPVLNAVVTLTEDVTIDRYVTVGENGKLIVPNGRTLTVQNYLDVEGKLFVNEGGRLVNNYEVAADCGYIFLAEGSYVPGEDTALVVGYADYQLGIIEGIDTSELALAAYTCASEEDVREVLEEMADSYQIVIMKIRNDITIENDLYIPGNVIIRLDPVEVETQTYALRSNLFYPTFTVISGATITNDGRFEVVDGTKLIVDGEWQNNLPDVTVDGIIGGEFFDMDTAEVLEMIENGETWIEVIGTLTVDQDLVIPHDVIIFASQNAHILVNEGAKLIVNGELIGAGYSTITVNGKLVNKNYIRVEHCATLNANGNYIVDDACTLEEVHAFDEDAWINGVPGEFIHVIVNGCSEEHIRQMMVRAADMGAPYLEINIYDELALTGNLVLPENARLTIENWDDGEAHLLIPENVTLNNQGTVAIGRNGTLTVDGKYQGKLPEMMDPTARFVVNGIVSYTQTDLENLLNRAAENGEFVNLSIPMTLTRDLVIPENAGLVISGNGCITIPAGRTVTVNGWIDVTNGGQLINSVGGVLKNNGSISAMRNGTVDLTKGAYDYAEWAQLRLVWTSMPYESSTRGEIRPYGYAHTYYYFEGCSASELGYMLNIANSAGAMAGMEINICGGMMLTEDMTLPEGAVVLVQQMNDDIATVTIPDGVTLTNNGHIQIGHEGHVIVEEGGALKGNQPIVFVGTGSYVNNNFTEADLRDYIDRKAAEGTFEMPAEVYLSNDITLTSDLDIPWGVNLVISKGGALRVPDGVTLKIFGKITTQMGTGLFIEGGTVETVCYMEMDGTSKIGVIENIHGGVTELTSGEYINGGFLYEVYNGYDLGYYFNEETGEMENAADASMVRGIPVEDRILVARGTDEGNIRMVLALAEALGEYNEDYGCWYPEVEMWVTDGALWLDEDLVIPEYASMQIWNHRQYGGSVNVPEGITLTNNGIISIGDEGYMEVQPNGTLANRGNINVWGNGTLRVLEGGAYLGSHPYHSMDDGSGFYINENGFTQADLEAMIEAAQTETWPTVVLGTSLILTSDLEIPEGTLLRITGMDVNLIIPEGTALINNGRIRLDSYGSILGEGGHLENNGEIDVFFLGGRLDMTNGTYASSADGSITSEFTHNTGLMRGDSYVAGVTPGDVIVNVQGSETEIFRTAAAEAERIWHEGNYDGEPVLKGDIYTYDSEMVLEDYLYWPPFSDGTGKKISTLTVHEYSTLRIPAGATLDMFGALIVNGTLIIEEGANVNAAYPICIGETGTLIMPDGYNVMHYRPGVQLQDYEILAFADKMPVFEPFHIMAESWTPVDADINGFRYTVTSDIGYIFGVYDEYAKQGTAHPGCAVPFTSNVPGTVTVEVVPMVLDENGDLIAREDMAKSIDIEFVNDTIVATEKDAPDFYENGSMPGLWAGGKVIWNLSAIDAITGLPVEGLDLSKFQVDYDPALNNYAKVTLSRGALTVTALSTVTSQQTFDITVTYEDMVPITQTIVLRPKLTATGVYHNGENITSLTVLADLNRYEARNEEAKVWLDFLAEPYDAYPANDFNAKGEKLVTWTSSAPAIATVDENGCVTFTGEKTGKVKITVNVNAGVKKTAFVTFNVVRLPQSIVSAPANEAYLTLVGGSSANFYAAECNIDGSIGANLTAAQAKWYLCDENGEPIDSHPYVTLTATGKLTTKAVADETKIYLMAQVIGDEESAKLDEPVCVTVYPAVESIRILDAADGNATGMTLLYDFVKFSADEDGDGKLDYVNDDGTYWYPLGWAASPYEEAVKSVEWKSSKPTVADIDNEGNLTIHGAGSAKFTLTVTTLNNKKLTASFTMNFGVFTNYLDLAAKDASGNDLDLEALEIYCNEKITFSGECLHIDDTGAIHDVTTKGIVWSVKDKTTASITSAGVLTPKTVNNPVEIVVVATSKDGRVFAEISVTVKPKQVLVNKVPMDALYLYAYNLEGEPEYLTKATKTLEAGDTLELFCNEDVTWTSNSTSVATVDKDTGVVTVSTTAANGKSAVITATATDGSKRTATVTIKVNKLSRTVEITTKKADAPMMDGYPVVSSGKTLELVATVKYPGGTSDTNAVWSLVDADASVATVSSGKITAAKNLTEAKLINVRATAKDGNAWSMDYPVWVLPLSTTVEIYGPFGAGGRDADVTNLSITWDMRNGRELDLYANLFPMDAFQGVTWKSSATKVATIDEATGELTCLTSGTTSITATAKDGSGKKATFKLTVMKTMEPGSLTLPESAFIGGGKSLTITKLEGYGIDPDATNKKLTWSMTDAYGNAVPKTVATLSTAGVLATKAVTEPVDLFIRAEATDGSGEWDECTVTVYPIIKGIKLFNTGTMKDVTSKTVEISIYEDSYSIYADATNVAGYGEFDDLTLDEFLPDGEDWDITYSKAGLVTAEFEGSKITFRATDLAKSADSVKITLKARDGSAKTAYFTLKFTGDTPISVIAAEYGPETAAWWATFETDFEKANSTVDLTVDVVSWNDIYDVSNSRIASGNAPDILNIDTFAQYAAAGKLLPAESYISEETYGKFFTDFLEESRLDGTVWAVPDLASARALFYNKTVLSAAGVAVPTSFAELYEASAALKEAYPDMIPFGVDMTTDEGQATFTYFTTNNGGGFLDADGNWKLNSAANVEAVEFLMSMVDEGLTNSDPLTQTRYDLQDMFATGQVAMMIGPNQISEWCAEYGNVTCGVAPIPTNYDGDSVSLGIMDRMMCFDNGYTDAELAAITAFFDFFYQDQRYAKWTTLEGFLPATSTGCDALAADRRVWKDILDSAEFYPADREKWPEVRIGVIDVLQRALLGENVRDLLDQLQEEITGEPVEYTEISLWTYPIGAWGNEESVNAMVSSFEEETGIRVDVEYLDYSTGDSRIDAAIESAAAPDLVLEGPERLVTRWGRRGHMVNIADMLSENDAIYPGVLSACYDGTAAYEYPLAMTAHCMAINKTVFEAAGAMQYIDEDTHTWTTENFLKAVQAVYEYTGTQVGAVYCAGQGGDQGTRALVNNLYGGTYTNEDHTAYTWNSQENIDALVELANNKAISFGTDITGGDEMALFYNGRLNMAFCWNIMQQLNPNNEGTGAGRTADGDEIMFMAFPSPEGTDAQLQGGIWGFGIFDNGDAERIAAAKQFVEYVCNSEATAEAVSISGYFPVRGDVTAWTEDAVMLDYNSLMGMLGDYYQVADGWAEARTAWWNMLQEVAVSGGSAEMITEIANRYTAQANGQ